MNVNSVRPSGIPAARPQERPAVQENLHRGSDAPLRTPSKGASAGPGAPAAVQAVLTDEEQRYFEKLFPGAVMELRTSPEYSRTGIQPAQETGSLLDRKG